MNIVIYLQDMWRIAAQGEVQGICFWAALYLFIVCFYSLIFQYKTRIWPMIEGEFIDAKLEKFNGGELSLSDKQYKAVALYRYNVSGHVYEGSRISPWLVVASHNAKFILEKQMAAIQHDVNGKIKVFYNSKNPKKSFLVIASKKGMLLTFVLAVLPLIIYLNKYHL